MASAPPRHRCSTKAENGTPNAIEAQLAHVEGNLVRRAYARAEFWEERVKLMGWWANRLDDLRRGGEVIPISAGRHDS